MEFGDEAKDLLDGPNFGVLATLNSDGSPQVSTIWVARDGDEVLMSTAEGRAKQRNLAADPRASLLVLARDNPYRYVEIRGATSITHEGGRELIDDLNRKYTGGDRYTGDDGTDNVRVVIRLTPDRVRTFG